MGRPVSPPRFIDAGGWDVLNSWLSACKSDENPAFLLELMRVYQHMPVTIDLLKKNSCAKVIKQLSKGDNEGTV